MQKYDICKYTHTLPVIRHTDTRDIVAVNGVYTTTRGCSAKQWEDVDMYFDHRNQDLRCFRRGTIEHCICSRDGCNGVGRTSGAGFTIAAATAISARLLLLWRDKTTTSTHSLSLEYVDILENLVILVRVLLSSNVMHTMYMLHVDVYSIMQCVYLNAMHMCLGYARINVLSGSAWARAPIK